MADFQSIFNGTEQFERGYQNNPNDNGNYCNGMLIGTNRGISAIGFQGYYGRCPTIDEMKNLSPDQAFQIAKKNYWDIIQGDKINSQALAHIFFDSDFMSGFLALKEIRQALNKTYGKILVNESNTPTQLSDYEIQLINDADLKTLSDNFYAIRTAFYQSQKSTSNSGFVNGWINRLNSLYNEYASQLITSAINTIKTHWLGISLVVVSLIGMAVIIGEILTHKETQPALQPITS